MMSFLYTFGIALYTLGIRVAAPFNSKANAWVNGRKGWKAQLEKAVSGTDKWVWFHAASLGEFEQGRPVMEALRKAYPNHKILLTFFSPSGFLQKQHYEGTDLVMYLPPDCKRNTSEFVKLLHPALAVFIKYEFWYNYLAELKRNDIPTVFISSLIKGKEPFFKWYGGRFRKILRGVDHFFVQDQASKDRLLELGIKQTTLSGDTRFDRVADILANKRENKDVEAFCKGSKVLLAGSTWPQDEEVLSDVATQFPDLKIVIAPHEVKEERIRQLVKTLGGEACRFTLDDPSAWIEKQVLVIDTIGILSTIYRYADIAYIGGAFATGLHNIQEPAVNGIPIIFGPKYMNFREAVELVELGGAFSISSGKALHSTLKALLDNEERYNSACRISKDYMLENTGATEKIMKGLAAYL
jgi:3-deoxy-D-manno-octulosonic-acid transferase